MQYCKLYNNALSDNKCNNIIEKYLKQESSYLTILRNDYYFKNTYELRIPKNDEWKNINNDIIDIISKYGFIYYKDICNFVKQYTYKEDEIYFQDYGFNIQVIKKNIGYINWHTYNIESRYNAAGEKTQCDFAAVIFLNTVEKGGEITFKDISFKPVQGSILLYPTIWSNPIKISTPLEEDLYYIEIYMHFNSYISKIT